MPKRLNVLNDFAFQKTFGEKGDEPQLLAFLNATMERTGKGNLESVEIIEAKDLPAEIAGGKSGKLDVLGKLRDGTKVNVEVQIKNNYNIEKRSLYYWSRKYTGDFKSGEDYSELVPVITVNIVDYSLFSIEDYHTSYHLWEDRNKEVLLTDAFEIHFLDMVKFRKVGSHNLDEALERWLAYFDEYSPEELVEEVVKMDGAIGLAEEKLGMILRDPGLLRAYEEYEKAASDWTSGMNGARREGREEGEQTKAAAVGRKLKGRGYDPDEIADITGLDIKTIESL
ncbi:MAG: Rpn family recombination-promoting nuclease/putative transposase [Treponema sp.]|jgi:predicted transposase/invertase (TIGR01784 family)|nr:Rpn family recombination-promoting nuclease/putative transposase [Treponema sp.]